jgi:hypothetical protein
MRIIGPADVAVPHECTDSTAAIRERKPEQTLARSNLANHPVIATYVGSNPILENAELEPPFMRIEPDGSGAELSILLAIPDQDAHLRTYNHIDSEQQIPFRSGKQAEWLRRDA